MPRAAHAILAIACSAGALGPDSGLGVVNALRSHGPKQRRGKPLTKVAALKDEWEAHLQTTSKQADSILSRVASWGEADEIIKALAPSAEESSGSPDETIWHDPAVPEAVVMNVLTYAGTSGRCVSRDARRQCDKSLRHNLLLPKFPLNVRIQQHYSFGSEQHATSTWLLHVPTAASPGSMELQTETGDEAEPCDSSHRSTHTVKQVLKLWWELKSLQKTHGAHHKEGGTVQVQVTVSDASGREFLDHQYKRRRFHSKADDLLEILSEVESDSSKPYHSHIRSRSCRSNDRRARPSSTSP